MERISLFLLLFLCLDLGLFAQNETFPEGLRKLSTKEIMDKGPIQQDGLPTYGPDGKLWSAEQVEEAKEQMKYIPEYFANEEGKVVAIKLRELTPQEAQMIAQFREEQARLAALIGTEAKDFEATDMEGNKIKLSHLKGSVVAINFWFVGCKPCIMEMPELNEIVKEFEGQPVRFIAIALDKDSAIKKFRDKRSFDYEIVPSGRDLARLYQINGYPTHCIVDQEGKIAYFKSAYSATTASEITATLEQLLEH